MTIGEKIVELRKSNNLNQESLSERLNVSRQTLSNWENNITSPDLLQATKISKIFKISLDDLVDNKIEVDSGKKNILNNLIGKTCYIDTESEDIRFNNFTECKVLDVNSKYIKIEFMYKKVKIIKLLDLSLITSIGCEADKDGE